MKMNKLVVICLLLAFWCGVVQAKELPLKPVKINSASKQELLLLPGVGDKKAEEIIAARTIKPFQNDADLMSVKGIGEKTLVAWKGMIDYGEQTEAKKQ